MYICGPGNVDDVIGTLPGLSLIHIYCEYSTDESLANEITEYLQKDIIMDFDGYEERTYSERFDREDGSHVDIAACARNDAPGIVAIYYYTSPEFARNYTLTIQGLLNGYSTQKDGTVLVADDGIVVASNDESLLGQNTAENEVVQEMKKHTDSQHIYHLKNEGTGCYGIMLKQRDYYIYAYLPDTEAVSYTHLDVYKRQVLSTVLLLLFVIPISYVLARYRFVGSRLISTVYMACIFLQATYIMIPLFLELQAVNGLNNLPVLCLVYAVMQFPFCIFTLQGFMSAVPRDYEESARIDGATDIQLLLRVMVPLAKPGIATITMLSAMGFWNEYPLALVLLTEDAKKTLPIGMANLFEVQKYATDWGALFAGLVIVMIPTIIIYLIGQRYLLQGIGAGGLKG